MTPACCGLQHRLDAQSPFMLLEPGEREQAPDRLRARLQGQGRAGSFDLVAEEGEGGSLVGWLSVEVLAFRRARHTGYVVIGVDAAADGNRSSGFGVQDDDTVEAGSMDRRGNWMWMILILVLLFASGCAGGQARSYSTGLAKGPGSIYHDAAGWVIRIPPGWHVVHFRSSKDGAMAAGVQVSNVRLPAPSVLPGFPIQASGLVLPADGISLVIATDRDPKVCRPGPHRSPAGGTISCQRSYGSLPLKYPGEWTMGSASAPRGGPGGPAIAFLWFKANGEAFIATVKTGAKASEGGINELSKIVASFRVIHA